MAESGTPFRVEPPRDTALWNGAMEALSGGKLSKTDLYGLREKEDETYISEPLAMPSL
jgi:hypothetical protein